MVIAFASHKSFKMYQIEVNSAFMNGYLKKELFVCQPLDFSSHQFPDHLYKLDKVLYGSKKEPTICYERLSKFILDNGFTRDIIDNILFLMKKGISLSIVQVYVDGDRKSVV